MPLSPQERMDLMNDPRWQSDPQLKLQLLQALEPADAQWLQQAASGKPAGTQGLVKDTLSAVGGYAKEHPAEAGAIVGGLAAVPLTGGASALPAMAAAGLGGFGGANLGMLTSAALDPNSPVPRTSMGVAGEAGKQGLIQAGGEGVGRAMGATVRGVANSIQNSTLPKAIATDFPTAAETLNKNWINPTTEGGAAKATGVRRKAGEQVRGLAQKAQDAGTPGITRSEVEPAMDPARRAASAREKAGMPGGHGEVNEVLDNLFNAQFPHGDIQLTDAADVTRALQDEGIAARDAVQSAERPKRVSSQAYDNAASGVRRVARERIPGFQDANAELQGAVGAERASAEMRHGQIPLKNFGWRALPAMLLGGSEYARSGDLSSAAAVGALPIALGVPQISAPVAIALYQAGRLPFDVLVNTIGPAAVRAAGLTK